MKTGVAGWTLRGHCTAFLLSVILASVADVRAGDEPSASLARDFDAALGRLRKEASRGYERRTSELPPAARLGLDFCWSEANGLAKAHGPLATNFLLSRAREGRVDFQHQPSPNELAWATLAALADDRSAAEALAREVIDGRFRDETAVVAATSAPPAIGRNLGREALKASARSGVASLDVAGWLLRLFGDESDAEALRQAVEAPLLPHQTIEAAQRRNVAADLLALRQRLRRPPAERAAWAEQDRAVWLALHSNSPGYHDRKSNLRYVWGGLSARGRFLTGYLRDRLVASEIRSDEQELIIWTIEAQKETSLVPELTEVVVRQGGAWNFALQTLLSLGTPDALSAVKRLVPPPPTKRADRTEAGSAKKEEISLRARIIDLLVNRAPLSPGRVQVLAVLSADSAYPPEERVLFARARDATQKGLDRLNSIEEPRGMRGVPWPSDTGPPNGR